MTVVHSARKTSGANHPIPDPEIHFRGWALAVLVLAALLFFLRLGDRGLWGPEGRWAEITREMQLTGNYFWPTLNGKVYYDKPLATYWLIAAATYLTWELDELAIRLPGAFFGLLGVWLLMVLTRQLYGGRTAILAGFILATCYSYVFWARVASADIETVTGVLAALTLYFRNQERPNGWWLVGLWIIMALTSLTKGLQGFALPLLVIGVYSLLADGGRQLAHKTLSGPWRGRLAWFVSQGAWFFNRKTPMAIGIAVVVYIVPFAISFALMDSNIGPYKVLRENVIRFVQPFDHQGPVYLYAYAIFILTAPWCLFLPAALVSMHSKPSGKSDCFALVYFWATFIFFTLSGSRRQYYLLPILPAAAMVVGRLFTASREPWDPRVRWLTNLGYILMSITVVVLVVMAATALFWPALRISQLKALPASVDRIILVGFWTFLLMLIVTVFPFSKLRPERIAVSAAVLAYLFMLFVFVYAFPNSEQFRGEKVFAHTVRAMLNGNMNRLVFYKTWGPDLVYYLAAENPLPEIAGSADLALYLEKNPGDLWIVADKSDLPAFPVRAAVVARSQSFRWEKSGFETEYVLIHVARDDNGKEQVRSVTGSARIPDVAVAR